MTLPNRSGYSVSEPVPPSSQKAALAPPHLQISGDFRSNLAPFTPSPSPSSHFSNPESIFNGFFDKSDLKGISPFLIPPSPFGFSEGNNSMDSPRSFLPGRNSKSYHHMESLSIEEMHNRKKYIKQHRLLPNTLELLINCQNEGLLPPLDPLLLYDQAPLPGSTDFSLEEFISSQGIEDYISDEEINGHDKEEFFIKLNQLKEKYKEEIEKINQVCADFCQKMVTLLRDQSQVRPVSEAEKQLKIASIQQKFDYVRGQLRQNACNAIQTLQKKYNLAKRKKRTLPKKATEALSNWFYEHITDPYPSEEDKHILASAAGLTITQVNNWFGNKRIRYKRKCLEQEAKRVSKEGKPIIDGKEIQKLK